MHAVAAALLRRLIQAVLVGLIVGTLCFIMAHVLPGDMAFRIAAGRYGYDGVNAAAAEAVRAELGLDRPLAVQFAEWIGRVLRFDLGRSVVSNERVIDSVLSGQSGAFRSAVSHLILPTVALATIPLAVIARQTRSAMLEVMGEDYVRTARAKGMSPTRVVGVHALRNAMIPVITTIGLQVGVLMAGAILTETIFSWPGIGKWMIDSISRRDYPVVQSGLLLIAGLVMLVNLLVDLTYGLINPRIRHK